MSGEGERLPVHDPVERERRYRWRVERDQDRSSTHGLVEGGGLAQERQLPIRVGRGVVPKLMFPTTTVEGEYTATQSLIRLIKERAK